LLNKYKQIFGVTYLFQISDLQHSIHCDAYPDQFLAQYFVPPLSVDEIVIKYIKNGFIDSLGVQVELKEDLKVTLRDFTVDLRRLWKNPQSRSR